MCCQRHQVFLFRTQKSEVCHHRFLSVVLLSASLLNLFLFLMSGAALQTCTISNSSSSSSSNDNKFWPSATFRGSDPGLLRYQVLLYVALPCLLMPILPVCIQLIASHTWAMRVGLRVGITFLTTAAYMGLTIMGAATSACATPIAFSIYMTVVSTNVVLFQSLQQLIVHKPTPPTPPPQEALLVEEV